mgnify:CR=1 FL=1
MTKITKNLLIYCSLKGEPAFSGVKGEVGILGMTGLRGLDGFPGSQGTILLLDFALND